MNMYHSGIRLIHALSAMVIFGFASANLGNAESLRVVEYNIDCSDQGNNDNITGPEAGIPAILQAIGNHHIGSNAQPVDVLALTEMLDTGDNSITSSTLPALVNALNAIYGPGYYAYDNTPDPTSGGTQFNGPSGLIYNTHTIQVVPGSEKSLGYSGDTGNSVPRAPMRYTLQPVGYGANADFYLYVSHYKASSGSSNETTRNQEAMEIRQDADGLGPNANIIYTGDFNLAAGSSEPSYATLTAPGNGKAYDPTAASTSYISTFSNSSSSWKYLYSESTSSLSARFDLQLVSGAVLNQPGLQSAPDTADPFTNNFPSSQYPYAYEIFGNNNTTALNGSTNTSGNSSLSDLTNAGTIKADLMQPSGSDHLPVVADYDLVGVSPLPLAGDFNRDGHVSASDILAMEQALTSLPAYKTAQGLTSAQLLAIGDLNGDGKVNNADLAALLSKLKAGGGSADPLPEPSALTLCFWAICSCCLWAGHVTRRRIYSSSNSRRPTSSRSECVFCNLLIRFLQ